MSEYLQQLQADQSTLEAILKNRREALAQLSAVGSTDPLLAKAIRPSVKLLHQAYLLILEDALSILNSLIEYFLRKPKTH